MRPSEDLLPLCNKRLNKSPTAMKRQKLNHLVQVESCTIREPCLKTKCRVRRLVGPNRAHSTIATFKYQAVQTPKISPLRAPQFKAVTKCQDLRPRLLMQAITAQTRQQGKDLPFRWETAKTAARLELQRQRSVVISDLVRKENNLNSRRWVAEIR